MIDKKKTITDWEEFIIDKSFSRPINYLYKYLRRNGIYCADISLSVEEASELFEEQYGIGVDFLCDIDSERKDLPIFDLIYCFEKLFDKDCFINLGFSEDYIWHIAVEMFLERLKESLRTGVSLREMRENETTQRRK